MSGFSVYQANKVLDKFLKGIDFTVPSSYWCGLFTDANAATFLRANDVVQAAEQTGGAYVRIEVRGTTGINWSTAASGHSENDTDIIFPEATAPWNDITAVALLDASTAGNVIIYDELDTPITVAAPDIVKIPANRFDITL